MKWITVSIIYCSLLMACTPDPVVYRQVTVTPFYESSSCDSPHATDVTDTKIDIY